MYLLLRRVFILLFFVGVIPACGSSGGSSGVPASNPPAPLVILSDNWDSGPSANWSVVTPIAVYDAANGNPPGSMKVDGNGAFAEVVTAGTFNSQFGLTVSLQERSGLSSGLFEIVDNSDPGAVDTYASFDNDDAVFKIKGASSPTITFANDGAFHTFKFTIVSGNATWSRDGVAQFSKPYTVPRIYVRLADVSIPSTSGTYFDNFLVTFP